jgi:hypothetical protein
MNKIRFLRLTLIFALIDCGPASAATIYALMNGPNASLERIDTVTKAITPIGVTGVNVNFGDLANNPTPGFAYMVDGRQLGANGVTNSSLYSLNLATGAATLIGNTGVPDLFGLAYDPNTATLFGTTFSVGVVGLYSVNTSTGAATFIGPTQDPTIPNSTREVDGLTYNTTTHSLVGYSTGFGNLYTINEATGALTLQAHLEPTGLSINHNIGDLAYDAATNKYFSDDVSSGAGEGHIYITDPNAPVFNDVAIIDNLGQADGILVQDSATTTVIPEPSTFVVWTILLGMIGIAWACRRMKGTTLPA